MKIGIVLGPTHIFSEMENSMMSLFSYFGSTPITKDEMSRANRDNLIERINSKNNGDYYLFDQLYIDEDVEKFLHPTTIHDGNFMYVDTLALMEVKTI